MSIASTPSAARRRWEKNAGTRKSVFLTQDKSPTPSSPKKTNSFTHLCSSGEMVCSTACPSMQLSSCSNTSTSRRLSVSAVAPISHANASAGTTIYKPNDATPPMVSTIFMIGMPPCRSTPRSTDSTNLGANFSALAFKPSATCSNPV